MPLLTDAQLHIDVGLALRTFVRTLLHEQVPGVKLGFKCPHCKQPVRPTKEGRHNGTLYGAHFEHLKRNPKCEYSDAWDADSIEYED